MEEDEVVLEEGELSSDSGDGYTPLERPSNYSKTQPLPKFQVNQQESEEDDEQYQSSDSDSDPNVKKIKKPKIRLKPRPPVTQKNKKYDIWSTRLQEDSLAATLDSCDVVRKDRSREVESYDYSLAYKYYNNESDNTFSRVDRTNNKRTMSDRHDANFRQRQRSPSEDKNVGGAAKVISDLIIDINSESEDLAKEIADKLGEENVELILKVINVLGKQKAVDIFKETQKVETDGGMLIMNKTRRRTSGGVYLFLVRQDYHITFKQRNEIFGDERRKFKQQAKEKQRKKMDKEKKKVAISRNEILPDLLKRAELFASQNTARKIKETGEQDFVNPPPTPETDGYENSRDGMEGSSSPVINTNDPLENDRGRLNTYDDDFLDIGCSDEMDLF